MTTRPEPTAPDVPAQRTASRLAPLREAHDKVYQDLVASHGGPVTSGGERCAHVVLATGPLARGEDLPGQRLGLLFVYETDEGQSEGAHGLAPSIALHAWFTRLFTRLVQQLGRELDPELRLEGGAGPICNSLDALHDYLERFGGADERRRLASLVPVAGDAAFGAKVIEELAPFVFRRSLDASLTGALRAIPAARLRVADLVDTLAVALGGRHQALQSGSTRARLDLLAHLRLLAPADAESLRRLHEQELAGAASEDTAVLQAIVAGLAALAERPPGPGPQAELVLALDVSAPPEDRSRALRALGFTAPDAARERLDALSRHPDAPLHRRHATREGSFAMALIGALGRSPDPDQALLACDALSQLLRGQSHAGDQLAGDPRRLDRLALLFATDVALTRHLLASPDLFSRLLYEGGPGPELDLAELRRAPVALRALLARRLYADHQVARALAGVATQEDPPTASADERLAVVLACALADVDGPEALPYLLLRREGEGLDLDTLTADGRDRAPRRLLAALQAAAQLVLSPRPGRRPFTLAELERHLAEGGVPPRWRILAGPAALATRLAALLPQERPA